MKYRLVKKDLDRVAKFGREYCYKAKTKRKSLENYSLSKEMKKRQADINKIFTYQSDVDVQDVELVRKVKNKLPNICKHRAYGCDTTPRHKTERSKHWVFFGKAKAEITEVKEIFTATQTHTVESNESNVIIADKDA